VESNNILLNSQIYSFIAASYSLLNPVVGQYILRIILLQL